MNATSSGGNVISPELLETAFPAILPHSSMIIFVHALLKLDKPLKAEIFKGTNEKLLKTGVFRSFHINSITKKTFWQEEGRRDYGDQLTS
jgi:hypothetical protein